MAKAKKSTRAKSKAKTRVKTSEKKIQQVFEVDANKLAVPFLVVMTTLISTTIISLILIIGLHSINSNIKNYGIKGASDTADEVDTADTADAEDDAPVETTTSIDDDVYIGDKDKAKVAIVEFSDFECPYCKMFHEETLDQIKKNFIDTGDVIFVYRDLPLSFHEPNSSEQAIAAECVQDIAGNQKGFEFGKLVYSTTTSNKGLDKSKLYDLAAEVGVDAEKFKTCLDEEKFADEVNKDIDDATEAGINGTPAFVIGLLGDDGSVDGVIVSGAQPYSVFESTINDQLERAK